MTLSETTKKIQDLIQKDSTLSSLTEKEIVELYQSLIDCLIDHNHLYYVENKPIISDYEYDQLFDFLKKIENYHPYLISSDSPTQWLIWQIQDWFNQAEHKVPLLSLENTYNAKEIEERNNRINKIIEKSENRNYPKSIFFIVEPKFDGISVEIIYKDWKLNQAITRWDGKVGEDITINTKTIKNLPKTINYKNEIHIRWEIMMPKSILKKINQEKEKKWESPFANTRNATAGSIKLLDSNEVKKRELVCYLYDILYIQGDSENTTLENLWLPVFPRKKKINEIWKIISICEDIKTKEELTKQDIDFDGLVIKVQNENTRKKLWSTAHHPRRAIAYKFPAQQISTQIDSIDFQVGRTGIITPVANLTPVELSGVKISRVSLHNFDFIKDKNIHYKDFVRIQRSWEVIPYIVNVIKERRSNKEIIKAPNSCPSCKQKLTNIDIHYYCTNASCPAQIKEKIIWFVSKNCMDIEGIGESIVDILVNQKIISNISDLYKLLDFETQRIVQKYPGFANKKITEIQSQLRKSKQQPLWRILTALWIPGIGKKTAQDIENTIINAEKDKKTSKKWLDKVLFYLSDENFLLSIYGIWTKIISAIINFVEKNSELLRKLEQLWVNFSIEDWKKTEEKTNGITFSITWSFQVSRSQIIEAMQKEGYTFHETPKKDTQIILIGENAGSKEKKAEELWIKIIQWRESIINIFPFIKEITPEKKQNNKPSQIWLF